MQQTHNLGLPLLYQGQLNKDITVNSSFLMMDALLHASLKTLTPYKTPPQDLESGDMIIVSNDAEESFAEFKNHLAFYSGGWHFIKPKEGLILWVKDAKKCVVFNGKNFEDVFSKGAVSTSENSNTKELEDLKKRIEQLENLTKLGVNAKADDNNKLTVRSNYSLFNAESGDVRIVLNKHGGAGKTASFIFQSNWNGVAEFGTIYGDNFILKVAHNGSWKEVFEVDAKTGIIHFKCDAFKNGNKIF